MKRRAWWSIALCGLGAVLATLVLHGPMDSAEEQVTALKYRVRGDVAPDSSIVLVYIDDASITSLGWPVRRNFYALLVQALTELQARAIGLEVFFEEPKPEYPEYDELLAGLVAANHRVVLSSYFTMVQRENPEVDRDTTGSSMFHFPGVTAQLPEGRLLHLPFAPLRTAAAGIGHLNLEEGGDLPLYIRRGTATVPAFAEEVLRVALGADRQTVIYNDQQLRVVGGGRSVECRTDPEGVAHLLFPGRFSCYTAYPFLEVLKSYDAARSDLRGSVPVLSFKDKIILVGVVAEGRSRFVRTPVQSQYPSLGLHATFIDNALQGRFCSTPSRTTVAFLTLLISCLSAGAVLLLRFPYDSIAGFGIPALVIVASFFLFAFAGVLVPVIATGIAGACAGAAALLLRHRQVRETLASVQVEKTAIQLRLHDREARVASLERELLTIESARQADRTAELLEELRRTKSEIRDLTSQADDLEPYAAAEEEEHAENCEGIVYDRRGKMNDVVSFITKVASSDAPVLILGESGTGKELVARALHKRSTRAAGPFIAVNCGALAETLLESELFGHEKGAFTGAVKDKAGRFEMAEGGTIFLDEIGEVSEAFQIKLLRALQEGEIERVGGTRTLHIHVRVIAATNKALRAEVEAKRFREDLYYRLNVLTVALPPLRERTGDIPLLIEHFLRRDGGGLTLSKNLVDALCAHPWRGNIRELESALRRAALLARADHRTMVTIKDVGPEVAASSKSILTVEEQVLNAMREKGFSRSAVTETADELGGLNRGTVAEYLRGEFLKALVESQFDVPLAVARIAMSADNATVARVRKRLQEYVENIVDVVDQRQPWETARLALRPKTKNLPQKYHPFLEQIGEAHYRGILKPIDQKESG
jgi:transcriptional regulator with GAF, ATPase, and Fis domain/CHASE2 domain-containing sensor protein